MREKREEQVLDIMNEIFLEINKPEYMIGQKKLEEICKKIEKVKVRITALNEEELSYHFYYVDNGNYYGSVNIQNWNRSFVLEYPPVYRNHDLCDLSSNLSLAYYENDQKFVLTAYHEITHLIASGEWKRIEDMRDVVEHKKGICTERYFYRNEEIEHVERSRLDFINEAINDWVSKYLFSIIEDEKMICDIRYKEINNEIAEKISKNKITEKEIVSYYILNNEYELFKILDIKRVIMNHNRKEEERE